MSWGRTLLFLMLVRNVERYDIYDLLVCRCSLSAFAEICLCHGSD